MQETAGMGWPENLCKNREKIIGQLEKGRRSATQLQTLLLQKKPSGHNHGGGGGDISVGGESAEELAMQILASFTESLSVLTVTAAFCGSNNDMPLRLQQTQIPDFSHSACSGEGRSEGSCESRKRPPGLKDRRGCYKRRRSGPSRITCTPTMEDGYAWRKYGQKEILNSEFPRCYFRCTHKYDQSCRALKQVQKIKGDSIVYQTTYFGHHTCRDALRAPHIISDSDPAESCLLSFQPPAETITGEEEADQEDVAAAAIKEEAQSEISDNRSSSSPPPEHSLWPQGIMGSESPVETLTASLCGGGGGGLCSSGSTICSSGGPLLHLHGLEMESFNRFSDFDHEFYFDDDTPHFL